MNYWFSQWLFRFRFPLFHRFDYFTLLGCYFLVMVLLLLLFFSLALIRSFIQTKRLYAKSMETLYSRYHLAKFENTDGKVKSMNANNFSLEFSLFVDTHTHIDLCPKFLAINWKIPKTDTNLYGYMANAQTFCSSLCPSIWNGFQTLNSHECIFLETTMLFNFHLIHVDRKRIEPMFYIISVCFLFYFVFQLKHFRHFFAKIWFILIVWLTEFGLLGFRPFCFILLLVPKYISGIEQENNNLMNLY